MKVIGYSELLSNSCNSSSEKVELSSDEKIRHLTLENDLLNQPLVQMFQNQTLLQDNNDLLTDKVLKCIPFAF